MNESEFFRSHVEYTRINNYFTHYVTCAQQNTDNYQKLDLELIIFKDVAEQALNRAEYDVVLEMARWLWSDGGRFLDLQGHTQDGVQLLTQAVEAARLSGNRYHEGRLLGQLGRALLTMKELSEAGNYFEQAVKIAREVDDQQGEASHLGCLGQIYLGKKNKLKAADYFQEALSIARKIGERQMEGRLLAGLGLAKRRHSFDEAIKHFEQAVAIARETGDRQGEASHLGCLGTTWELFYSAQPEPPKPTEFVSGPYLSDNDRRYIEYREAVVRYEQACQAKYDKPIEYFKQALAIAREIGDKQLVENLSDNLGRLAGRPVGRSITVAIVTHHDRYVTAMTDEDHQDWALRATTKTLNDREKFTLFCLDYGKVVLQTYHRRYVTAMNDEDSRDWVLRAETIAVKDWEKFTLVEPETIQEMSCTDIFELLKLKKSIRIALKTHHDRYVTAMTDEDHQDWALRAATKTLNDREKFTVILL